MVVLGEGHLEVPGGLYTASFWVTMNKKAWDRLSAAHKAALDKAAGVAGAKPIGRSWDEADKAGKEAAVADGGHNIQTIAPEELERWRAKLEFMRETWIKKTNAQGLEGRKLLSELLAMMKQPTN